MGFNIGPTLAVGGEAEYNAAMKRVKESMTYVKAEASAAISVFDKNKQSVESLTAQINGNKNALDVQKQAVKAAEDALERMRTNGVEESSTAYKRMKANLDNAKATMNKTDNEVKNLETDLKKGGSTTQSFGGKIKEFASSSIGQFASITAGVALAEKALTALWNCISESAKAADELSTLSSQTGITTDTLQKLSYASAGLDVEVSALQKGLSKTVKAFGEAQTAGQSYIDVSDGLSVSTLDVNGKTKDSEQLFYDLVDALGAMSDKTQQEAAAQELFGKSYQDLMPLIDAGSGALKEYGEEAEDAGAVVDDGMIKVLGKLNDKMEENAKVVDAANTKIAASFAVTADAVSTAWTGLVKAFADMTDSQYKIQARFDLENGLMASSEEVDNLAEKYRNLDYAVYITGLSEDEVKLRIQDMSDYLIKTGTPASEAYAESLSLVTDKYTAETYAAEQALDAEEQMVTAQKTANDAINAAADTYVAKWTEYQQAIESTAADYTADLGGLFEKFDAGLADSQEALDEQSATLLTNLQSQESGMEGWATTIEELSTRAIDQGLLQELRDMGPEAYAQVQALNNMTDTQLKEYSGLYQKMGKEVTDAATNANADVAHETEKALETARVEANNAVVKMKALGVNLGEGLGDGMNLSQKYVTNKLQDVINKAIAAAVKKNEIKSPSKRTARLLGNPLGAGVGVGWADAIRDMTPDIESAISSVTSSLASAVPSSFGSASMPSTSTTSITKEIIRDSGITVQFLGDTHINNGQDMDAIATGIAQKVKRALAAQGVA